MAADFAGTLNGMDYIAGGDTTETSNHVLLVEDSRAINQLLVTYLSKIPNVRVESSDSLAGAGRLIAQKPRRFFCAVLDLNLPDAPDGEVVALVQEAGIPVIVLTGSFDEKLRQRMLRARVVDYVLKRNPAEVEHLSNLVERVFKNQHVKVLVVDDSKSYRAYLVELLRRYRYQVLEAVDGKDALQQIAVHPEIGLIITDYNMPRMDGRELIERIRRNKRREEMAIIGLSDQSRHGTSAMLLKSGANDFLFKRFEVEEFYCRVTQNTEMIGYVRQIRDAATRDFLTKSFNRRHFFELAAPMFENANRGNLRLATAIVDADHFKNINDTHGHDVGDEALKLMARTLERSVRATDIVARYGGEEFVCLSVIKTDADAPILFERIRANMEQAELFENGKRVHITVSIGVTTNPGESLNEMLIRADRALYEAKRSGRNRVVIDTGAKTPA